MVYKHILSELHAVSEVADERCKDVHIVKLAGEKLFQILHIAFIVREFRVCLCAESARPHHLVNRFHKVRLHYICRAALVHQFVNISFFVFHSVPPACFVPHLQNNRQVSYNFHREHSIEIRKTNGQIAQMCQISDRFGKNA